MESAKTNSLSNSLSRLMPESLISNKATTVAASAAPTFGESVTSAVDATASSTTGFFESITWQTWLIIILILAFLGINIFIYLAKATTDVSNFVNTYFGPILRLFGFSALETTKQTINTSATGTKAGVDIVANTTTGAIDTVEDAARSNATTSNMNTMPSTMPSTTMPSTTMPSTTSTNKPAPQKATSSQNNSMPVQQQIQQAGGAYEWSQSALDSALNDASKQKEPQPNESTSYTTGKAGWCYIGDDRGTRSCAEVGVNDTCMSGDIFPTQDVCMNPNLRV
jgi:hypothetical protein